jgi:hypothetical protein
MSNTGYIIIALAAISILVGVSVVLPLIAPPAAACYRCWGGQSDDHRNDQSDVANPRGPPS